VTTRDDGVLVLDVESDQTLTGCPDCGVVAVGHGRRVQVLHDAPCFARAVRVRWFKRIWRCREPACPRATWTEDHSFTAPRAKLTARAVAWAVDALRHDDTTVSDASGRDLEVTAAQTGAWRDPHDVARVAGSSGIALRFDRGLDSGRLARITADSLPRLACWPVAG
jgi:transposase